MSSKRPPLLLIGVGNLLQRDDGVGVHATHALATQLTGSDVEVVDAGTAGLTLAPLLEHRARVVVVDAIDAGAEPGAIFRLSPDDLEPATAAGLSLHDVHLLHALAETELLGRAPAEVVVFAVQVSDVSSGIGMSPAVERALPRLQTLVAEALAVPEPGPDAVRAAATPPTLH